MRVIFLDMDGVLNSVDYFDRNSAHRGRVEHGSDAWWTAMVDPAAVERLNSIVEGSGAKVVISSSWRYHCTPKDMQRILSARGFRGEVVGRTPHATEMPASLSRMGRRGLEVEVWLAKHKHVEDFVILDDLGEGSFEGLLPRLVRTSWGHGLLDEHVERALEVLS
jgi:hypothetical protein